MEIDELLRCLQTLLDDERKRPLEKKVLLAAHNRLALQVDEIERLRELLREVCPSGMQRVNKNLDARIRAELKEEI